MSQLSVEGILETLDRAAEAFVFPMLDNGYVYLGTSRLSAFRTADDWAIVFEIFGHSPRVGLPDLFITTLGSRVLKPESPDDFVSVEAYQAFARNNPDWRQVSFFPIENEDWIDAEYGERADFRASSIILRGRSIPVPRQDELIAIDTKGTVGDPLHVANVTRWLAENYESQVLGTDSERRSRIPADHTCLISLSEWRHPDVVNDEKPSESVTFRQLAQALVSGKDNQYTGETPNNHWVNWPAGGIL